MRTAWLFVSLAALSPLSPLADSACLAVPALCVLASEPSLEGAWEGKEGKTTLRLTLRRDGEDYTGEVSDGEDAVALKLTVTGNKVAGRATRGDTSFDLVGEWTADTLTLREKEGDDEIVFTRAGAKAAAHSADEGELLGAWRGEIDGEVQNLVIRRVGDELVGTVIIDDEPATLRGRREGDVWKGVALIEGGKEKVEFVGTFKGDALELVAEGKPVKFARLSDEQARLAAGVRLEASGIVVTPPHGWTMKRIEAMTLLTSPDERVLVMLWDEPLKGRSHEEFADAFKGVMSELGWQMEGKGWRKMGDGQRSKGKFTQRATAEQPKASPGFAGVETRGEAAIGALLVGEEADLDKVGREVERMMKHLRWPGAALDVKIERKATPPAPPSPNK